MRRLAVEIGHRPVAVCAVMTAAAILLHVWSTRNITHLARHPADQYGYLANARWLSGDAGVSILPEMAYYGFGYSLFLVPAFWLFDDPAKLTQATLFTNAVLMAALVPLLYAVCRKVLCLTANEALLGTAVAALVPATLFYPSLALAENLLIPLTAASVLTCWLYLTPRAPWQRLLFSPVLALLFSTHERYTFVIVWSVVVIVAGARWKLVPGKIAAWNIGTLAALLVGSRALRATLIDTIWQAGELITNQSFRIPHYRKFFLNPTDSYRFLIELAGHAWYVAVGTLGLAVLGVLVLLRIHAEPSPVDASAKPAARERLFGFFGAKDPMRLTIVYFLGSGAVMLVTSSLYFSLNLLPSEGFIYGRYSEPFIPPLVAAGVVGVRRAASIRHLRAGLIAAVTILVLTTVLVLGRNDGELTSYYTAFGVPDVARFTDSDHFILMATIAAFGAVVVLTISSFHRRLTLLVVAALGMWLLVGGLTQIRLDPYFRTWTFPSQIERLGIGRIAVNLDRASGAPPHNSFYVRSARTYSDASTRGEETAVRIDALRSQAMRRRGARIAFIDEPVSYLWGTHALALWVLPGPQADRLAARGVLLPAGFPTTLPREAQRARLWVPGDATNASYDLAPGATRVISVCGRHAGSRAPWPDAASFNDPGRVRIATRPPPANQSRAPARSFAELPRWVWPGDSFCTELRVAGVDPQGRALPAGSYDLAVGVEQVGFPWFGTADESLRLKLRVS